MKKSMMDIATDKLHERVRLVNDKMATTFKNTKPYRGEPVSNDLHRFIYENMSPEDLNYAIQQYGRDTVNSWMGEIEMSRRKL